MFLLAWPPWHPSPSQRLSSAHNLASRIGRSMRSVSSWRSKEPWNTCQARFVDRFCFPTTSVLYGDPPVSLRCWSCSEASGASFPLARTTDPAHECDRDVSEMTICWRFGGSIWSSYNSQIVRYIACRAKKPVPFKYVSILKGVDERLHSYFGNKSVAERSQTVIFCSRRSPSSCSTMKWLPYLEYFIESNLELEVLQKEDIFERLPKQASFGSVLFEAFCDALGHLLSCRESVMQNLEPQQKALCDKGPTRW